MAGTEMELNYYWGGENEFQHHAASTVFDQDTGRWCVKNLLLKMQLLCLPEQHNSRVNLPPSPCAPPRVPAPIMTRLPLVNCTGHFSCL